jgi:hypothetical protein
MIIYQQNSALLTKYLFKKYTVFEANQCWNLFLIRSHIHHIQTHLILWSEEALWIEICLVTICRYLLYLVLENLHCDWLRLRKILFK